MLQYRGVGRWWCATCNQYQHGDQAVHDHSIAHMLEKKIPVELRPYQLSATNRGYQMLVRYYIYILLFCSWFFGPSCLQVVMLRACAAVFLQLTCSMCVFMFVFMFVCVRTSVSFGTHAPALQLTCSVRVRVCVCGTRVPAAQGGLGRRRPRCCQPR